MTEIRHNRNSTFNKSADLNTVICWRPIYNIQHRW